MAGITFDVYAKEDVISADGLGTVYYEKDALVATIKTNDKGVASIDELHIGKYYLVETTTLDGFILDSTPKLTYKDPEKDIIKGTIYLNKKCKVFASRQDIFHLDTPKRVFIFKCKKQNDIVSWISAIKDCIKKYGKEE